MVKSFISVICEISVVKNAEQGQFMEHQDTTEAETGLLMDF